MTAGRDDARRRRVIIDKTQGIEGADTDTAELDKLTYLLESGSERIVAHNFQRSPTESVRRTTSKDSVQELITSAEPIEKSIPITPELDQTITCSAGNSI